MSDAANAVRSRPVSTASAQARAVRWLRANLFSSWRNTALTLVAAYLIYLIVPPLVNWAIVDANWGPGTSRAACTLPGVQSSSAKRAGMTRVIRSARASYAD